MGQLKQTHRRLLSRMDVIKTLLTVLVSAVGVSVGAGVGSKCWCVGIGIIRRDVGVGIGHILR